MDFVFSIILKLSLAVFAIGGVFIGHKYLKMKNDNVVEQIVEEAIKEELGIEVDLSPEEPMQSRNYGHREYNANGSSDFEGDQDKSYNDISRLTPAQLADMEIEIEKKIEELKRIDQAQSNNLDK